MTALAPVLLLLCGLLVVSAVIGMVLWQMRERRRLLRERLAGVARRPAQLAKPVVLISRAGPTTRQGHVARLTSLFGFDLTRTDHHGAPWWVVLVLSLVAARLAALMAQGILGEMSLLLVLPLWVLFSRAVFGWWDQRRRQKLLDQFPDAIGLIVRMVRVGLPVAEAIRTVGQKSPEPLGSAFARVANEMSIGVTMERALRDLGERTGVPEFRFFATALTLQAQTGGALTETLDNLADVIRRRIALRARGYALASEARTSSSLLTGLPFVTGLVIYLSNSDYMRPMFTEPFGHKMLGIAALLMTVGTVVMRGIIRKALS